MDDPFDVIQDANMPFLKGALNPHRVGLFLGRMLQSNTALNATVSLQRIQVLRHKAGRRCLIEYVVDLKKPSGEGETITLLGKARARGLDRTTYRICGALWNCGFDETSPDHVSVPQTMGTIPEFEMWFQRKTSGGSSAQLLMQTATTGLPKRIAEAIHKVHKVNLSTRRSHSMADELRILHERLPLVAEMNPDWTPRLERILAACDHLGATVPIPQPTGIHRDFYLDHVLIDGDRLYLIDFDLFCMGDPALDIGNFLAHLIEQSIRAFGDAEALQEQGEVLREHYLRLAGKKFQTNVEAYTILSLVRHIHISTLFPNRRPFTQRLLSLCEQRLGLAASY
ncbi:MAG: phosphotransferase family protein [bacterium]